MIGMLAMFRQPADERCGQCSHFEADPRRIETALPNLSVMGSAYASVIAGDGLCLLHDTYQSHRHGCGDWTKRPAARNS